MNNAEFQEFYEKYYEFSTRIANKIVKSHVVAEDISQETFFNLYKIKDALDCSSELRLQGLVAKAAVNKARDYLRKNYTKREIFQMDQRRNTWNLWRINSLMWRKRSTCSRHLKTSERKIKRIMRFMLQ